MRPEPSSPQQLDPDTRIIATDDDRMGRMNRMRMLLRRGSGLPGGSGQSALNDMSKAMWMTSLIVMRYASQCSLRQPMPSLIHHT